MLLNKKNLLKSVLFVICCSVFAQTQSATEKLTVRYLDKAMEQYEKNQMDEALKTINAALQLNETSGIPANVTLVATQIYSKKLDQILLTHDYTDFQKIVDNIGRYPSIADGSIKQKVQAAYDWKEADIQSKKIQAEKAERAEQFSMYQKQLEEQQKSQETFLKTMTESLADSQENVMNSIVEFGDKLSESSKQSARSNHIVLVAILVVLGVIVLVFVVVIICVRAAAKASTRQSMQFEETLKLVAGMQQTNNQLLLGSVTDLQGISGLRSAGSSRWGVDALPAPEMSQEEKDELKKLAVQCEELGSKIDAVTNRKNNSKNISELVYKLALKLGCNQNTAMAYFCAAMVYDAGFLGVPEDILTSENISEDERLTMQDHVNRAETFLNFVPETYRKIFFDAAVYHHENEDGSGYPGGIKSDEIPQVAKLIHVVESYNSLISRRNYKAIKDKESAIEDLLSKPNMYDQTVVKALDSIV